MKITSTFNISAGLLLGGIALTWMGRANLEIDMKQVNPMAIRESGYGMTLARLSQDTVNRVWHIGVEQVDPHDHDHDHDHGDHAHGDPDHDHAPTGRVHTSPGHRPGDPGPLERTLDHLKDLKKVKIKRTSKYGLTERHRLTTSREIENTLKRSYSMDPTNYGVYNAYYLFLTIHDLGATDAAKERAVAISNQTIRKAFLENENPEAYLTAGAAALNLFFTEQGRLKMAGQNFSKTELEKHSRIAESCLREYQRLRKRRQIDGTWNQIPDARRAEMAERARFAGKTREQFAVMLARMPEEPNSSDPETNLVKTKTANAGGNNHE